MTDNQRATAGGPARLRDHVARVVADAIGVPVAVVTSAPSLFDVGGFDSLTIVAVLDRLERDLAVEVPPERIVPEAFGSVDALCDLMSAALPSASAGALSSASAGAVLAVPVPTGAAR